MSLASYIWSLQLNQYRKQPVYISALQTCYRAVIWQRAKQKMPYANTPSVCPSITTVRRSSRRSTPGNKPDSIRITHCFALFVYKSQYITFSIYFHLLILAAFFICVFHIRVYNFTWFCNKIYTAFGFFLLRIISPFYHGFCLLAQLV